MRTLLPLLTILFSATVMASELRVEHTAGWAADYTLTINFTTGAMVYHQKAETGQGKEVQQTQKLTNFENVGKYVKELMERIPVDKPVGEFGDDSPVYKITLVEGDSKQQRTIGSIHPPSSIHLNEGLSAQNELAAGERFKACLDAYLLCLMIDHLAEDLQRKVGK